MRYAIFHISYGIWHVAYAIFSPTDMRQTSIFTEIRFLLSPNFRLVSAPAKSHTIPSRWVKF